MSTQPATVYVPQFGYQPRSYAVHNAGQEAVSVRFAGLAFTVPPVDAFSHNPAIFADGAPIPGTLSLSDAYTFDATGNIPPQGGTPNWFAAEAVKHMLGIDTQGVATSAYAKRGLSVLPDKPSREVVEEIRKAGELRYFNFLVEWAQYTVMAWQDQAERSRRAGVPALPPGPDFYKASIIIEKHNEEMKKLLGVSPKVAEMENIDDDLEFQTYAMAEALALAKGIAQEKGVSEVELAEKLMENPRVRLQLQKKYSIRKRGHLEQPVVGEDAT
jgi:hypothetical protein